MEKNVFEEYTGQYTLSKTLRFELIPQGKTQDYIEADGVLSTDEKRAEDYKIVKKVIDAYHKQFLERALSKLELERLDEYYALSFSACRDDKVIDQMQKLEADLRKQVVKCLEANPDFKILFKKELITQKLPEFTTDQKELAAISSFKNFTTYFKGFFENRKNMYSDEEKSTAVAYRIINQNLPRFIDNMRIFETLMNTELCADIISLQQEMNSRLQGRKLETFFTLEAYSGSVTNSDITLYNAIIGGVSLDDGTKIKGINGYVNEFNQRNKKERNIRKLPLLKPLYKQILADRETLSFVDEQFDSDEQVLETIFDVVKDINDTVLGETAKKPLEKLLKDISSYDLNKIYIANGVPVTNVSNAVYGDWSIVKDCIEQNYDEQNPKKSKKKNEKYYNDRTKAIEKQKSYSIGYLNGLVEQYNGIEGKVETYFSALGVKEKDVDIDKSARNLFEVYRDALTKAEPLLCAHAEYHSKHGLASDTKSVEILKSLLDAVKDIESFVKPLINNQSELEKDDSFYGELDEIYTTLSLITLLYNRVRNYVTKKPYSTEKVKLNFHNPTLLDGWDLNKERDNLALIFRKNGLYYLGIMNKKHNKSFLDGVPEDSDDYYEKMEYKLLPGPNKMLPKVFFAQSNYEMFEPSDEIISNYEKGTHKKTSENFDLEQCHALIDFFKDSISKHEDWNKFGFKFTDTSEYKDISQFYHEVEKQGYKVSFKNVVASYIDELVESGKLYLFQIYNKDFSSYSKGMPNLHTIYWKMLFDERNLANPVYKLNGEAEVFYRRASIEAENIVCHKKNEPIQKKNLAIKQKGETSEFDYDIIKDRRYTVDKYQFHVPITLNFCAEGRDNLNDMVMASIRKNKNINVIGIDRGERNLLYISVVSPDGKILHQQSLNVIENTDKKDNLHRTDYHELLDNKEKTMDSARKNWTTISSIKELKEGYLSQAIHVITDLMIQYNAIVVLEDLNFGFMNGRKKVGKQVYQKFEKMLIDKLNYLVDKKLNPEKSGGALHAYQLTNQFKSFAKLGKQSGFLFYVPAWNTSKVDPTTGFVNLLYPKYTNMEETRTFIRKFDVIRYNEQERYFEFSFDYTNFTDKAAGTKTDWTICSYGERIINERNKAKNNEWDSMQIRITDRIMEHLHKYGVEVSDSNMIEAICSCEDASFYKAFLQDIRYVLQIRNSVINSDIDYMLSPVKNEQGEFFDTRKYDEKDAAYNYFPKDADANGAYNIARKGLWIMDRIREASDNKVKLAISNKEWLSYAQENTIL